MLVVFWSPNHGQTGTTSTAINHAIVTTLITGKKVLLGHGDFKRSTLENCFIEEDSRNLDIYRDQGLSALIKLARNGRLNPNMIKDYTTPILSKSRLDLMQGSDVEDSQSDDLDILRKIFLYCNDSYDYTFIDLHSGINNEFTKKMLDSADLIVVCLNQNLWLNNYFFESSEYQNFLKEKNLLFHINLYNSKSKLNLRAFKHMFKIKNLIYTNRYDEICESQNASAIVDFVLREYSSKKSDFAKNIENNVNKIIYRNN